MTIPASGPLALTDIQTEFGGTNPIGMNEYYAGGGLVPAGTTGTYGAVPSSGALSVQNFYGTSNYVPAYIEEIFQTYIYTGNGSSQTITNGINLSGNGGLVWTKARDLTISHALSDTVNGGSKYLSSDNTGMNQTSGATTFGTTGYTLTDGGGRWNSSGASYVSWAFQEKQKFFDVVTYTGNFSTQNIAHNLGSVPACIIIKSTSLVANWSVYHRSLGNTKYLRLNLDSAETTDSTIWDSTTPTSSVFTVGANLLTNTNTQTYVAYIFAHDAGGFGLTGTDNVISCGSVNTPASGITTVNLGYEPQWVLIKRYDAGNQDWFITDNMRGFSQTSQAQLSPNLVDAESVTATPGLLLTATGFSINAASYGGSRSFIYIAIRRGPMAVPTLGTSVYNSILTTGTGTNNRVITGVGFPTDLFIANSRAEVNTRSWQDKLRGPYQALASISTNGESTVDYGVSVFGQDGYTQGSGDGNTFAFNANGKTFNFYFMRRAPSFFDEVCYTGTGTAGQTFNHNLTVVPELMIMKRRDSSSEWFVYSQNTGNQKYLQLQSTSATSTSTTVWNDTTPTSSVFTLGSNSNINTNGSTYVAYLFATAAGVSKVGSYTGNGSTQTINCGFGAGGVRFVIIKRTDSTGDWYVYDTARGMTVLTDPYLLMNSTAAETATLGSVTTVSTGFALNSAILAAININAANYIFLAIA